MVKIRKIPINLVFFVWAIALEKPRLSYTRLASFSGIERGGNHG